MPEPDKPRQWRVGATVVLPMAIQEWYRDGDVKIQRVEYAEEAPNSTNIYAVLTKFGRDVWRYRNKWVRDKREGE